MVEHTFTASGTAKTFFAHTPVTTRELHKFGGSSLADVGCFLRVANIIREHCGPHDLFVVSAAGKTTNRLVKFVDRCGHDPFAARIELSALLNDHLDLVNGLLIGKARIEVSNALRAEFTRLRSHAEQVIDGSSRARILGHGEVWSARLLSALLNQFGLFSEWLDSRTLLRAEEGPLPVIDQVRSRPLVRHAIDSLPGQRVIITGFMASNDDAQTVLLGRNGSDYSATMIGALAGSPRVTIWSDTAGVYTADPKSIETARLLPVISLHEANQLASLGAPVLHHRSLQPVIEHNVVVSLRSSFTPESPTTRVERRVSGIGPKVVTALGSVAVFAVSSPSGEACQQIIAYANESLAAKHLQVLAHQVTATHGAIRMVFAAEVADEAQACLAAAGFTVALSPDPHSLIAVVGAGVAHASDYRERFVGVVSESTPESPMILSSNDLGLVAVLKNDKAPSLVAAVHSALIDNV